jgi:hypothetical protein
MPDQNLPDQELKPAMRIPSIGPTTLTLVMLSAGLIVSLAANVRQDRKADRLGQDLASLRQQTQKQIADLREAQSATLEHDLLRINELTELLEKSNEDELHQAASIASHTRAELGRMVEQRHQEMITAISDLRADLRSEAAAKTSHPLPVQSPKPGGLDASAALRVSALVQPNPPADPVAKVISQTDAEETYAPPQRKGFWSHLNPFSRNKKRQDPGGADAGQ